MYHIRQQFNLLYILEREKYYTKLFSLFGCFFKINILKRWSSIWNCTSVPIAVSRNTFITSRKVFKTCSKLENLSILHIEYEQLIYCVVIYVFGIKRGFSLVIFLYRSSGTSVNPCQKFINFCLLFLVHFAHQGAIKFLRSLCPYNGIPNLNFVFKRW